MERVKKIRCEFCGYNRNPTALMKHHQKFIINPKTLEIDKSKGKVYVLCANCHYILHNILYGRPSGIEIATEMEEG